MIGACSPCGVYVCSSGCSVLAVVRFVPPVSGSEITCELEFTIPEDDRFFDDKVRSARQVISLLRALRVGRRALLRCLTCARKRDGSADFVRGVCL